MSRFEDLDQFLRRQETSLISEVDNSVARRIASRDEYDPMVREVFEVFGDWYSTIIKGRTDLVAIPKKKETPENSNPANKTPYIYRVNLVSQTPSPRYARLSDTYYQPGEIGDYDWHPNVGLQFDTELALRYDFQQNKLTDELEMRIRLMAWGGVNQDEAKTIVDSVTVDDKGWYRIGTSLLIMENWPREKPLGKISNQIGNSLRVLTPNVLNHRQFWHF